jgi:hypothetical protein
MKQHRIAYTKISACLVILGFCSIKAHATPIPLDSSPKSKAMTLKVSPGIKKSMQQRLAEFKERLAQRHQKMTKNASHEFHPPAAVKQPVAQQHPDTKANPAQKMHAMKQAKSQNIAWRPKQVGPDSFSPKTK